jgi:hypothetical protein
MRTVLVAGMLVVLAQNGQLKNRDEAGEAGEGARFAFFGLKRRRMSHAPAALPRFMKRENKLM